MPNKDDNAVPAGGVDPALSIAVVDLADAGYTARTILAMSSSEAVISAAKALHVGSPPCVVISADFPGGPVACDLAATLTAFEEDDISNPFVEIGYGLPEDGHARTRKTSSPKAKTRDHDLHMKTVKELAQLDIGFFMHIDEKAGKATLRRPGCQTVIFLTHKSRWLLAGRNKTTHGTVAEFATWYRNNIGVS